MSSQCESHSWRSITKNWSTCLVPTRWRIRAWKYTKTIYERYWCCIVSLSRNWSISCSYSHPIIIFSPPSLCGRGLLLAMTLAYTRVLLQTITNVCQLAVQWLSAGRWVLKVQTSVIRWLQYWLLINVINCEGETLWQDSYMWLVSAIADWPTLEMIGFV